MSAALKIAVHRRAFAAPIAARPTASHRYIPAAATTYKVTFVNEKDGTEKTVNCDSDDYILDAADAGGMDIPASCRGGVCGTCVSRLVSGKVDQSWLCELDDGNVLTAEQMKDGFILPCSAKPESDLRIEYSYTWGVGILEKWAHTARA